MKNFWTSTSAAKELGIDRRTVIRRLQWLEIKPDKLQRKINDYGWNDLENGKRPE